MGKGAGSELGTGGMTTKIEAARTAVAAGTDMVLANGDNIYIINDIMAGKRIGTLFVSGGVEHENEMAPEKETYRGIARHQRKMEIQKSAAGGR